MGVGSEPGFLFDKHFSLGEWMGFADRSPSTAWEMVTLADSSSQPVWVWFKPPNMPQALVVKAAIGLQPHESQPRAFSMRQLLDALSVDPPSVGSWYLGGMSFDGLQGMAPYFDQPIPPALLAAGELVISIDPMAMAPVSAVDPKHVPAGADRLLEAMAADWEASIKIERQMVDVRKQLSAMSGRLNTLNRDLTPEESAASDRLDKNEWRDARRWLREAAARLSRCIKEHDIGDTSGAGQRAWFEQMYRQFVVPRRSFDGLESAHREFQGYRKRIQTVLQGMTAAYAAAAQDGEQRAQQVLGRIAAKIRAARTKRT